MEEAVLKAQQAIDMARTLKGEREKMEGKRG